MKRLLSLLLAVTLILSVNTGFVFADSASEHILFSEDFNDYSGESTLPEGWAWTQEAADGVINDTNPEKFGYGNDTALKIKSDNHSSSYTLRKSINPIDITSGIVKLSFQVNFEHIEPNTAYTQTLSVYAGNTNGPYIKGLSIVNGKVRYYSGSTTEGRWNASYTSAYLDAGEWYTFEIISDYNNNKTVYYMNGEPLYDDTTGKIVETAATFSGGTSAVTSATHMLIGARTRHSSSKDGGDVYIDNITITKGAASGVYAANGSELFENPLKLDIKFNNVIDTKDFSTDEITVNTYAADDVLMSNATPVNFTVENLSQTGCEIVFDSEIELLDYDKIKVDFGGNKDMLGGKLSFVSLLKIPIIEEEPDEEVIYDSDNSESSLAQVVVTKADVTEYPYTTKDGKEKSANLYTTTTAGGSSTVEFSMKDDSNIIALGNEYTISFRIKPLETDYWKGGTTRDFNFRGLFDTKRNEDGSLLYNEGAVRWFYMSNRYRSIGYHSGNAEKVTAFGFDYKYNPDIAIHEDVDAMFNTNQWVDVKITYKPDNKLSSIAVEGTSSTGQSLFGGEENYPLFLSNKALGSTYAAAYPSVDTSLIDGELKTVGFTTQANGSRFILDDFKITRKEIIQNTAKIKSVLFKDMDGATIQNNGTVFDAGINEIFIYADGAVNESVTDEIALTGTNSVTYNVNYDVLKKVISIDFGDEFLKPGDYTVSLPEIFGFNTLDFSVAEGTVKRNIPNCKFGDNTTLGYTTIKNTSSFDENSGKLVIVSYKNGRMLDAAITDLYAPSCTVSTFETPMISTENADRIRVFVYDDVIVASRGYVYTNRVEENPPKMAYNYTGNADTDYVTAILMNPKAEDKSVSYTLQEFSEEDAFSYLEDIKVKDGKYSVEFDIRDKSGKYTLYIISLNKEILSKKEIYYSDSTDRAVAQNTLKTAVESNATALEFKTLVEENSIALGFYDIDLYANADIDYVSDMLYKSIQKTPVDTEDIDDIKGRVADICIVEALNDGSLNDISNYKGIANVFKNEFIKTWLEKNLVSSSDVVSKIKNKTIADEEDLSEKLTEALALEIIDAGTGYGNVKDILEALASKGIIDIDISEATIDVYRSLDGNSYDDYADLEEDYNKLIKKSSSDDSSSGSGRGSSGSKRGSSGGVASVIPTQQIAPTPIMEYVFDDISGYDWAVESITNLYKNNIISGKGDKSFAPQDNVLREEFVKMIVGAFAISGTTDVKFVDVSDKDWFKPYVDKAYGAGIISGEGESFGAGKCITRQDMAKIIYEVALKNGKNLELADITVFADNGEIADYAINAVSALYKNGIVNGRDNGIFAPRDLATRAEAAVIISRAMNLIK